MTNTYRGIEYTSEPQVVEAVWDGNILTYRGQKYQRNAQQFNELERARKVDRKKLRYRGAQLAAVKS